MSTQDNTVNNSNLFHSLKIDCKNCSGLCCVALYCSKSDGFPENKEAGIPCKHLQTDFRCDMHKTLFQRNMKGCLAYECFGAGQKVTQMYGLDCTWQTNSEQSKNIYQTFLLVFQLHQMLWYLLQASTIATSLELEQEISSLIQENQYLTSQEPNILLAYDITPYHDKVNQILKSIVAQGSKSSSSASKMFLGKNFKGKNLDGKDFSMSLLIAANLEHCSLHGTNFLGADLRDANLKNTDLSKSIFLTQMQINSAKGNQTTRLPDYLTLPSTWL